MREHIPSKLSGEAVEEFQTIYTKLSGKDMTFEEAEKQGLLLMEFVVNMFEIENRTDS